MHWRELSRTLLELKTKFVEIDDAVAAHLWDWLPAQGQITVITNNASKRLVQGTVRADIASLYGNFPLRNSVERTLTSVLSNSQFHLLFRVLEQHEGVDLLTEPSVITTLSGRQTQIRTLEYAAVITNWTLLPSSTGTNLFQTQNFPVGPALDIIPDVSLDDFDRSARRPMSPTDKRLCSWAWWMRRI